MNEPTTDRRTLDKREVAALIGVSVRSVERLMSRGVLKGFRPGGVKAVRFDRAAVLRWIEHGCPRRCH